VAEVTVRLPGLLAPIAGASTVGVEAATLAEALDVLVRAHPELRVHLFDESGRFRQHVLCFHNRTNTKWVEDLNVQLADGDTITIMQAVSGG
jgi:molybdopterin converting factor small subunit